MRVSSARVASIFLFTLISLQPSRAQIQATSGATTSLGTSINGQIGGTCVTGSCIITGGVTAGKNTFHRFDFFKANILNGITSVTFDGTPSNGIIFASVLSESTSLNTPISISSTGSLVFMSPNGINVGNSLSLTNVSNLVLSTADSFKLSDNNIFFVESTSSSELASFDSNFKLSPSTFSSHFGDKSSSSIIIAGGTNPSDNAVNIFVHQSLYLDTLGDIIISNSSIQSDPFLSGSTESYAYFSSGSSITIDSNSDLMINSYTTPSVFYSIPDPNPSPTSPQLFISSSSFVASPDSTIYTAFSNPTFKLSSSAPTEPIPEPPSNEPLVTNNTNAITDTNDTLETDSIAEPDSEPVTSSETPQEQITEEQTTDTPIIDLTPDEPPTDIQTTEDQQIDDPLPVPVSDGTPETSTTPNLIDTSNQNSQELSDLSIDFATSNLSQSPVLIAPSTLYTPPTSESGDRNSDSDTNQLDTNDSITENTVTSPQSSSDQKLQSTQSNPSTQSNSITPSISGQLPAPILLSPTAVTSSFSSSSADQTIDTINTLGLPSRRIPSTLAPTPETLQQTLQTLFRQLNNPSGI